MLQLRKFPPSKLGVLIDPKFIFAEHLHQIEELTIQLYEDKFNNLSIQLPIRHSKSTWSCVVALWILMWNPSERIIIAAFSKQAAKEMLMKVRNAIMSYGKSLNNIIIDPNNCRSDYFKILGHSGECRAVSLGTRFSHSTGTSVICDDILTEESASSPVQRRSAEDWFFNTLLNRRTKSDRGNAKVITTMTPRHPEDVLALLEANNAIARDEDKWIIHRRPAIENGKALFPELWPLDALEGKRKELEDAGRRHVWDTVWMCDPHTNPEGGWPDDYLRGLISLQDVNIKRPLKIIACDPNVGASRPGDYGCVLYAIYDQDTGHIYVEDVYLARASYDKLQDAATDMYIKYQPDGFLIETNNAFVVIADNITNEIKKRGVPFPNVYHRVSTENKIQRIDTVLSPLLAQHKIHLKDLKGNRLGLMQMKSFPSGENDDYPDCIFMIVQMITELLNID
jgi:hypothetical protein